ncbi:MAG: OmpA family protein [Cyclobacteriaceae bacterium]|nr:OmpA family protein [Cyclobacteriaceae bacterium]
MKSKITLLIWCCLSLSLLKAQNLVENGDFESYYACPTNFIERYTPNLLPGWTTPDTGTPDYFNRCSKFDAGVPYNWAGVAEAYQGNGYIGLFVYSAVDGYREYLKTTLLQPLQKGKKYILSFSYKYAGYSLYSIDRMGISLSGEDIESYVLEYVKAEPLDSATGSWEVIRDTLVAKGGETQLTIGNFSAKSQTKAFHFKNMRVLEPMLKDRAYYYIDDIRLRLVDELPLSDTLQTDRIYTFRSILFEYNKAILVDSTLLEIHDLAFYLKDHPDHTVSLYGHTDETGSPEYNQTLSEKRAKAVADYLIYLGIEQDRVTWLGFGESQPISPGQTEAQRQLNRRVEFKLTD